MFLSGIHARGGVINSNVVCGTAMALLDSAGRAGQIDAKDLKRS